MQTTWNVHNICTLQAIYPGPHSRKPLTSVFLRALVRGGDGDGVEYAAVLPSVVGVADTLDLVTAGLRAGQDAVGLLSCLSWRGEGSERCGETKIWPRGGSRSWRSTSRDRSSGWRCWRGGSGAPDTSCLDRTESRLQRSPGPSRRPARRGPPCRFNTCSEPCAAGGLSYLRDARSEVGKQSDWRGHCGF